jgi:hypothetical protein
VGIAKIECKRNSFCTPVGDLCGFSGRAAKCYLGVG